VGLSITLSQAMQTPGGHKYKSMMQQADLHFPLFNIEGKEQQISFDVIFNQKRGVKFIQLKARSNAGRTRLFLCE